MKLWIIIFSLLLLFVGISVYKTYRVAQIPCYQKQDEVGSFWTEAAVHYRWAKMIAEGKKIPKWDQRIQYPEGVHPFQDETPIMELVSGKLYLWLHLKMPFHQFIALFNAVFSTLTILPLFGVAYLISGNFILSLLSSALFGLSIANISSPLTGSFIRENFALTFIFSHFYFLLLAFKTKSMKWSLVSGAFLYVALLSWHLAQFYYVLLVIFAALAFLWNPKRVDWQSPFLFVWVASLVGGATIPSLVKGGYLFSFGALFSVTLLVALLLLPKKWNAWILRGSFVVVFLGLCAVPYFLQAPHLKEFSHVYQFLITKILYLGHKPTSPEALSYEAKVMWMSSFVTPSWKTVWQFFILVPFLAIPALVMAIDALTKKKLEISQVLLIYFCAAFAFLYWLILRMDCFLIFFLAALIPLKPALNPKNNKIYAIALGIVLTLGLGFNAYKLHVSRVRQVMPPFDSIVDMLYKIDKLTGKEDPILTPFPYGPSVAAFTGRPIIVHSKFENANVRRKVKEMESSIFQDEETFYQFCQKYGARYVVIDVAWFLDLSTESVRYRTNNMWASRNSAIYKMHFAPETLQHFKLLASNPDYRLFRVLQEGESRWFQVPPQPGIYDIRNFRPEQLQLVD